MFSDVQAYRALRVQLKQAKCTMADGNIARWDEGSWKTWDETEECGVPEDAFYCAAYTDLPAQMEKIVPKCG